MPRRTAATDDFATSGDILSLPVSSRLAGTSSHTDEATIDTSGLSFFRRQTKQLLTLQCDLERVLHAGYILQDALLPSQCHQMKKAATVPTRLAIARQTRTSDCQRPRVCPRQLLSVHRQRNPSAMIERGLTVGTARVAVAGICLTPAAAVSGDKQARKNSENVARMFILQRNRLFI